ncbi:hypothetical protein IFM89_016706 [Coptis chinensis]|uniref:Btz domain-containing protein n=1 Tax=Coptis chinensis TaxID=261450 RepID=A0A835IRZ7_9MAGN|nr:hypothetical protein IFM89_016706 [Coptis chinensis]
MLYLFSVIVQATMSRRETKRSSFSRTERESSPKRSRRDGKPESERNHSRAHDLDTLNSKDKDQKLRRRLQDPLPLEAPIEPESKVVTDNAISELEKTADEQNAGAKHFSDPTEVPRSRSYFQHDERASAGQGGRSFGRRATTGVLPHPLFLGDMERGWGSGSKERTSERLVGHKVDMKNFRKRDERTQGRVHDNNIWHHDRFHEFETDAPPPARKRPAFREKKLEPESGNAGEIVTESERPNHPELNGGREERGRRYLHDSNRLEKPVTGDRGPPHRGETQRFGFSSRDRFGGAGGSNGRDRNTGRNWERDEYRPDNPRKEKWKHDMFDEANKSPSPKTAEDQIAKVEALLAS